MNILGVLALLCFALAASVGLGVLAVLGAFESISERIGERKRAKR